MGSVVRERIGRIAIECVSGSLRLRWSIQKKAYSLTIGKDSKEALKAARAKAALIDSDIIFERFDPSRRKYEKTYQLPALNFESPQDQQINLRELWDKFLADKLPNLKAKSINEYESFTKLLDRLGKNLSFNALETKQLLLKITTVGQTRRMLQYLSACCNWGVKHRLIEFNPYQGLASDIPKRSSATTTQANAFSIEEREAVIQAFKIDNRSGANYKHYAPIVEFWFLTGCRPSEGIGLLWGSVADDFSNVVFSGSLQVIHGSHVWSEGSKNNKSRKVAISDRVQELLKSIKPKDATANDLVFPSPSGKPINYENFTRRAWNKIVDPIKPDTTPYNCRDTFITLQLLKGVPSAVIAKWCDTSTAMIDKNYADKLKLSQLKPID